MIVLTILNAGGWLIGAPREHALAIFSAGFVFGALGMYIAANLYGYRRVT